jgi:DNA-directed RNA polymerase specialized sigma24 family protein
MVILADDVPFDRLNAADSRLKDDEEAIVDREVERLEPHLNLAIVSKYWHDESSAVAAQKYNTTAATMDRWRFDARAELRRRLRGRVARFG